MRALMAAAAILLGTTGGLALAGECENHTGNAWARPIFDEPILDLTGIRYSFRIEENEILGASSLKIIFGWIRLFGPGGPDTYLLETNFYTNGLLYRDKTCATWPLEGQRMPGKASIRLAVPDYVQAGRTGLKSKARAFLPRQSYLIDGLPITKSDAITQEDMTFSHGSITVRRGRRVRKKGDFHHQNLDTLRCSSKLKRVPRQFYRRWIMELSIAGKRKRVEVLLPDEHATYLAHWELVSFVTEFFINAGNFTVYLWDFEHRRESTKEWTAVPRWRVEKHCGSRSKYGFRLTEYEGRTVMEISSRPGPKRFKKGRVFSLLED